MDYGAAFVAYYESEGHPERVTSAFNYSTIRQNTSLDSSTGLVVSASSSGSAVSASFSSGKSAEQLKAESEVLKQVSDDLYKQGSGKLGDALDIATGDHKFVKAAKTGVEGLQDMATGKSYWNQSNALAEAAKAKAAAEAAAKAAKFADETDFAYGAAKAAETATAEAVKAEEAADTVARMAACLPQNSILEASETAQKAAEESAKSAAAANQNAKELQQEEEYTTTSSTECVIA